jgi:DNA-directed RNA polymerase subunit RPC12/RpoP
MTWVRPPQQRQPGMGPGMAPVPGMVPMRPQRVAAQTVSCVQCGATIRVANAATEVVCPTCQATTPVDGAWIEAAGDYGRNVEALRGELERRRRAGLARQTEKTVSVLPFVLVIGGVLGTGIAGSIIGQRVLAQGLTQTNWMLIGGCVVVLAIIIVIAALAARAPGREHTETTGAFDEAALLGPKGIQCPSCGAHTEVDVGKAGETCSHCGSPLAVSAQEMKRIVWDANIAARTQAAATRPPTQFFNALLGYGACIRAFGPQPIAWSQLPPLAQSLGGEIGMHHIQRWMQGYWPAALPPEMLAHQGSFMWGQHRGYPVAVCVAYLTGPTRSAEDEWVTRDHYVHSLGHHAGGIGWPRVSLLVFVSAVAIPEQDVSKTPEAYFYRTSCGYIGMASFEYAEATTQALWQYIDQLCAQAQRDDSPPAPFIEADAAGARNEHGGAS